jgi:hypothetical protein
MYEPRTTSLPRQADAKRPRLGWRALFGALLCVVGVVLLSIWDEGFAALGGRIGQFIDALAKGIPPKNEATLMLSIKMVQIGDVSIDPEMDKITGRRRFEQQQGFAR